MGGSEGVEVVKDDDELKRDEVRGVRRDGGGRRDWLWRNWDWERGRGRSEEKDLAAAEVREGDRSEVGFVECRD